jgi:multiple sugar transport system substrate-binding protein
MTIKKFLKRIMPFFILLAGLILSSCTNMGTTVQEDTGNVHLTYMTWNASGKDGMDAVARAFEEENPGITVEVQVTPWDQYWPKLEASALGGSMPDLFIMHSQEIAKYAEGDVLMDLTDAVNDSELVDMSKYPQDIVDVYSTDEQILGVPRDFDTIGLWYNKEIFDAAGIAYPDDTWTWETLLDTALELTNEEEEIYGLLAPVNNQEGYYSFLFQNGGYVLSEDKKQSGFREPETIEAMQFYVDLSLKYGVSPTAAQFADNDRMVYFQSGRAAMGTFGSYQASTFSRNEYTAEHVDVAPLPKGERRATVYHGVANSMSAQTPHPEEAWKFLEFMSSEEGQGIMGEHGVTMPAHEDAGDAYINAYPQYNLEPVLDQVEFGEFKPYSIRTAVWSDSENELLMPVFSGERTVEEAAEDLVTEIENILATE